MPIRVEKLRSVVVMIGLQAVLSAAVYGQSAACVVPPTTLAVPGGIVANLRPVVADPDDLAYLSQLLMAIGASYHPAALTLGEYMGNGDMASAAAYATIEFAITKEGRAEHVQLLASSLSQAFDSAAVEAVDSAGVYGLPPLPKGASRRTQYRLDVTLVAGSDSAAEAAGPPGAVHLRWLDTRVPAWRGATPIHDISGQPPVYPMKGRLQMAEDSLLVRFAVGADGLVVPGTGIVMSGTYRDFAESIGTWLRTKKFQPATIGGCPVPAIMQGSFRFNIERN